MHRLDCVLQDANIDRPVVGIAEIAESHPPSVEPQVGTKNEQVAIPGAQASGRGGVRAGVVCGDLVGRSRGAVQVGPHGVHGPGVYDVTC